jgi:hypothetical protein
MAIPLSTGSNALRRLYSAAEKRDEEIRRRDHLLAAALERIPALEAPPDTTLSEPRGSRETASEEAAKGTTLREQPEPPQKKRLRVVVGRECYLSSFALLGGVAT